MPRTAAAISIDQIIRDAVQPVIERASGAIARAVAAMVTEQLDSELQRGIKGGRARRGRLLGRHHRTAEITKWVADRRARRVPNFVIKMTGGLDTKKKIVAKYGENAVFEIGKAVPKTK